jgi:hypothetical protein
VPPTKLSNESVDVSIPAAASIANSIATLWREKKARENIHDKAFAVALALKLLRLLQPTEAGDTIATAAAANTIANAPLKVPAIASGVYN